MNFNEVQNQKCHFNKKMKVGGSMVEIIKTVLLRWLGHMKGMKDNRSQKSMYEWIPTGRRKKGSSKLRVTRKQSKA